jgi:hypothetical protein
LKVTARQTIKGVGIETMPIRPEPDFGLFPCQGSGFKLVVQPYAVRATLSRAAIFRRAMNAIQDIACLCLVLVRRDADRHLMT